MKKLKCWSKIYPQGTKEGDEENAFFVALIRNPKYIWRSTSGLASETGLSKARVEEIIQKYIKLNMVYAHPKTEDNWGYWERVPEDMLPKEYQSLANKDHKQRIKNRAK